MAQQEEIGAKEKVTVGLLPADLSWSVAGMERSEPSLVPEWLKGAGGGVGGASHHLPTSSNHQGEAILYTSDATCMQGPHSKVFS